jgi:hypothetical protein
LSERPKIIARLVSRIVFDLYVCTISVQSSATANLRHNFGVGGGCRR